MNMQICITPAGVLNLFSINNEFNTSKMENLLTRNESRIANRDTIAQRFGTDALTTHRIGQNCNLNFIRRFLAGGDNAKAEQLWKEAHPFRYPAHDSRDFFSMDLDFIAKHLEVFGGKQFWTRGGWGSIDPVKNVVNYEYTSGYTDVPLQFTSK